MYCANRNCQSNNECSVDMDFTYSVLFIFKFTVNLELFLRYYVSLQHSMVCKIRRFQIVYANALTLWCVKANM